ncbi:protein FD [Impatiens glandulifera]|uniref:protein FD n=1 Tax=Impatiens glandulifera TaxID=253017 RepID=UPI001FB0E1D2|nr:protein FD [Impatiens glandulifera]
MLSRKTSSSKSKTMEEVWKDINLSSLQDDSSHPQIIPSRSSRDHSHNNTNPFTFQDFLGRPFPADPSAPVNTAVTSSPPPTILSLNSVPDQFHLLGNINGFDQHQTTNNLSYDTLPCSTSLPLMGKKRFPEPPPESNPGDRRHKRMIKNRESAARSRARKQAYTNELELEVAHLTQENARLKRQQEEICLAAAAQVPKKHSLHRTSTAPF